jgi:ribosomal-protein-alanine N-acetyltransferase
VCYEAQAASENILRVTPCGVEDLSELKEILRVSPEAAAWSEETLTGYLRQHPGYFFVASLEQHTAGFICGLRAADEGEILNLAVRPSLRHRGIGKALVGKLLHIFAQEHVAQVFLEVRESNTRAIAFYEGTGFRQVGRRLGYYQDPAEAALVLTFKNKLA